MKKSFRTTTSGWRNKKLLLAGLLAAGVGLANKTHAFETFGPSGRNVWLSTTAMGIVESGKATEKNVPIPYFLLSQGEYAKALATLSPDMDNTYPGFREYLTGLVQAYTPLVKTESEHFTLSLPPDQVFLSAYALPVLEAQYSNLGRVLGNFPAHKIRVEIYPDKETFSAASTLSLETLERSGAIGICKFHRLMIMSPQSLPLGYRWLDALAHEFTHLTINEMSDTHAELWLHEGTARYFETSYRLNPPAFLTPNQQAQLIEASRKKTLIPFKKMSPSLVYLKDQEEVSLAFAQVAYAISLLVKEHSSRAFSRFLTGLRSKPFAEEFKEIYRMSPEEFEIYWQDKLAHENWTIPKGAMSDDVRFGDFQEMEEVGADAVGQVRLGDLMRLQGQIDAALVEYEKALQQEPDNAVILLKVARAQLAVGNRSASLEGLRTAVKKNPNYITPHVALAELTEDPKEAYLHWNEAIALNPFEPDIHAGLARVYRSMGKTKEADEEEGIFKKLSGQ